MTKKSRFTLCIPSVSRLMTITALMLGTTLTLAACSNAKEQLGLNRSSPDEFMVVKRAPLSMPPDYRLDPPRPGTPRPQEMAPATEARQALFGEPAVAASAPGSVESESIFLEYAGAQSANPDIRAVVDAETKELEERSKSVTKRLIGFGRDNPEGEVLNPQEEAQRLNLQTAQDDDAGNTDDADATDEASE